MFTYDGVLEERKEPTFVQFTKEGDKVEGALVRVEIDPKDKKVKYTVEAQDGQRFAFLGTHKINLHLSRRDIGHYVEVRYDGEDKSVKKGDNFMRLFRVRVSPKAVVQVDSTQITDDDIPF